MTSRQLLVASVILVVAVAARSPSADAVTSLPTYGTLKTRQYAGYADATADGQNRLFYWFCESDQGGDNHTIPILLWLNGGPGASSLTGLLIEKLGPLMMSENGSLVDNPDRITTKHHLLVFDNPVGSGFSTTANKSYVHSEYAVRTQLVHALKGFFKLHPEYKANPFWVTGESYAGHYVPNVAWEISVNATDIPLQGVVIGNGMYNMKLQYPTLNKIAFANGLIDERVAAELETRQKSCIDRIDADPAHAGDYCENVTVRWLYSVDGPAGELFYYDIGLSDGSFFDTLTARMAKYLNRQDVREALHTTTGQRWTQSDETGPVADALLSDWTVNSDAVVEKLLERKLKVRMYNGVRDVSSCNHMGNLAVILQMSWAGKSAFTAAGYKAWPSPERVEGYLRTDNGPCEASSFCYATVLRTGHLVPTVVPEIYSELLGVLLA